MGLHMDNRYLPLGGKKQTFQLPPPPPPPAIKNKKNTWIYQLLTDKYEILRFFIEQQGGNVMITVICPFSKQALVFMCLQYKSFENTVGKGEIIHNEQFFLFAVSSTLLIKFLLFSSNRKQSSAYCCSLKECKICHLEKG